MASGRIRALGRLPEIDSYIRQKHGTSRPLTPEESAIMGAEVNAQLRVIRRNWPVETGTSRAGWFAGVQGDAGAVAIVYENPISYSGWITKKGQTPVREGGRPWFQRLVSEVFKANRQRLVRKMRAQIDKTEAKLQQAAQQGVDPREAFKVVGTEIPGWSRPATAKPEQTFQDLLRRLI
tara:strand:- start:837 stop:1373 length:537 start_codon:yes stop_codon:yes gene_type:complete